MLVNIYISKDHYVSGSITASIENALKDILRDDCRNALNDMLNILREEYDIDSDDHVVDGDNVFINKKGEMCLIDFSFAYKCDISYEMQKQLLEAAKNNHDIQPDILRKLKNRI